MHELMTPSLESADQKVGWSTQPAEGPLFVVGIWRSGTSLLYALLNQHPQIALMYEDDLAHVRSLFWFRRKTASWVDKWNHWNEAPLRHKFDTTKLPVRISDFRTAGPAVYQEYARQKKGASVWGCKSPTYFDQLRYLSRTFPNARFLLIWRGPTDICHSILEAAQESIFFSRKGKILHALLGYHEMKMQCDWLVEHGAQVHQLYYEDLVRDPETTMQKICEFLRIPFDPRMANLQGADRTAIGDGRRHSLVKSEQIVPSRTKQSALPSALQAKIERYVYMWRSRYRGEWPLYPSSLSVSSRPPALERIRDRVTYDAISFWHHASPVVFSAVPPRLWDGYRKLINAWRSSRLPRPASSFEDAEY
jgi:hypothetical protein